MPEKQEKKSKYKLSGHITAREIFTIPNILTYIRLILIPIFVWQYCFEERYALGIGIAIFAAFTDLFDGWIARKFNMVSSLGKILDPIADKLMQGAFIFALIKIYHSALILFALMAVKEILQAFVSYRVVKQVGIVIGSKWYGRVTTWMLDIGMAFLLVFNHTPKIYANIIFVVCGAALITSLVLYSIYCEGVIRENSSDKSDRKDVMGEYANKTFDVPEIRKDSKTREALKDVRMEYKEAKKGIKEGRKELRNEKKELRHENKEKKKQIKSTKSQQDDKKI